MFHASSRSSRNRFIGSVFATAAVLASPIWLAGSASAQTVSGINVAGSSNPFLAGMPAGSTADGDSAPAQSPVLINGLNLGTGGYLSFSVTGSVDYGGGTPTDHPDGQTTSEGFYATSHDQENGLGGYTAPANSLVGVFLTAAQPDLSAAPANLDFTSGGSGALGISFTSLSPKLKQVFFIGDGLTGDGSGTVQRFFIPTGATRFYLGTVDGSGWFNNSGQFTVAATHAGGSAAAPEPGTCALIGASVPMLVGGMIRRRRSRS